MSVDAAQDTRAPSVPAFDNPVSMKALVEDYERSLIESALAKTGNTRAAAKLLGISQATLLRKRSPST
jgi:transcriptional regulator with PAS, ATPase and Fis domain